ncbi:hypothetical protein FH969_03270 [Miniimonas arenae]|uniref:Integral membrane bound transporter domain-containing protein n=1 Tax=Miniimonas arenae TaxID=676201 RepID=A0A5C5BG81_9MICO|nr:FUSC family protein [Miniimonas arenae]TNU76412.1 hypothetical protein FH969_03270 [Miniimonas arenae]
MSTPPPPGRRPWSALVTPVLGRPRVRAGLGRVRVAAQPVAWASLAAGVAYAVAGALLGHPYPFFASVAAFSALGFSPDVQPRRVGELAFGVSLGVAMGELIQHEFGSGPVQTTVVVFLAALIGRAIDPSPVVTTQSAVQAIVVLGLPAAASSGGPVGRWTDALLGGLVALVFSLFVPKDPRRRPRMLARTVLAELGDVLALVGRALAQGDTVAAAESLRRGRATQGLLVAWAEAVTASGSTARISPAWRRHAHELVVLDAASEFTDRAVRTSRVLARRAGVSVREGVRDPCLAGLVEEVGLAARRLGVALGEGREPIAPREDLEAVAVRLDTRGERDPGRHVVLTLLRSITFDLLRVAGCTEAQATAALGRAGVPGAPDARPGPSTPPAPGEDGAPTP